MVPDGVTGLEKHIDHRFGQRELSLAHTVKDRLEIMGEFRQMPMAKRSCTAFD